MPSLWLRCRNALWREDNFVNHGTLVKIQGKAVKGQEKAAKHTQGKTVKVQGKAVNMR